MDHAKPTCVATKTRKKLTALQAHDCDTHTQRSHDTDAANTRTLNLQQRLAYSNDSSCPSRFL